MKESGYYARLVAYYIATASISMAVEAKITKTHRLPFACLAPHQERRLLEAEETLAYKISDSGLGQKPCDIVVIHKGRGVVVAVYYVPHETELYEIDIRDWITEAYTSKEKSLTKARAAEIGTRIFL